MPGADEITIGVLLAKSIIVDFVDTDLIIICKNYREKILGSFLSLKPLYIY